MSKKYIDNQCVVKFQNNLRKITMYFEDNNGEISMSMVCDPEFDPEKDSEMDLALLLASTLMNALNPDVTTKTDESPKVYDGND